VLAVAGIAWWIVRRRRTMSEYAQQEGIGASSEGSR
jgi:hypothetical protein